MRGSVGSEPISRDPFGSRGHTLVSTQPLTLGNGNRRLPFPYTSKDPKGPQRHIVIGLEARKGRESSHSIRDHSFAQPVIFNQFSLSSNHTSIRLYHRIIITRRLFLIFLRLLFSLLIILRSIFDTSSFHPSLRFFDQ